jgi:hypothetical protein
VRPQFKSALKTMFAPLLREEGFQGSGVTFRRTSGAVLQVVHLQGSRDGDSCCVEIGTHLMFLPTIGEDVPNPKKIAVHDCEFRKRLALEGEGDHWWWYGNNEQDAVASVAHLVATYTARREQILERYRAFPGLFGLVTPESLGLQGLNDLPGGTTVARAALVMARISVHQSLLAQASAFVEVGLNDLANTPGGGGLGIKRRLVEIEETLGAAG